MMPPRVRSGWRTAGLLLLLVGCGEADPPALRVGTLAFSGEVWTEVPAGGEAALADVAAWGLAVREGRGDSLFAPLATRAEERSRLQTLPSLLALRAAGVGEDSLRSAYLAAPEWELDVRHVIRLAEGDATAAEKERALREAEEVLRRARAGEDFAALAAEFSQEPGAAERGGLLEPGREGSWVEPFWQAAVALRPGEVSGVVESEYGFHVLRLDARRPVPFEEADRAALLMRLVPESDASAAMAGWALARPEVQVDTAAASRAREALAEGVAPADWRIALGEGVGDYTSRDLAAAWGALPTHDQAPLLQDSPAFAAWLSNELRQAAWTAEARRLGAPPLSGAGREELYAWLGRGLGWTATFRFDPEMTDEALRAAAIAGATAPGQEFRIARNELEGLRPLLRDLYPLDRPSAVAASPSSSEIP